MAVKLNKGNWDAQVKNGGKGVFVEFFSPNCSFCQSMASEFDSFANKEKDGVFKVGQVECTGDDLQFCRDSGIEAWPTLKFFPAGGGDAVEYSGGRTAAEMSEWAHKQAGQ
eukprot:TRINITY_DN117095_c0_g1_i1.p1 TRINITY_DN117095_c0_g1~~TRINITY_DN117095_c0_g1_i1.p1  ORF type:complete len:111 (+),score=32.24 TRINITY_DN117095_c0_g1_i1:3-335(+)